MSGGGDPIEAHVVLTGFMGTGKSAVGMALAAVLRRGFVDTDAVIEERHGPIPEIFAGHGEAGFRRLERELADELARTTPALVIATGGGMLLDETVAAVFEATGAVFCLTASPATIVERVTTDGVESRPLLDGPDPAARVAALLAERAVRYDSFRQVDTDGRTVSEVVGQITEQLAD